MTATPRIFRVAVAVALSATAPLVLRAEAAPTHAQLSVASARLTTVELTTPAPRHVRLPVTDTASKRDHGRTERVPVAPRRRSPRVKSGAATPPQASPGTGQYVPDQPWETEFFVLNSVPTRHFAVRLTSASGN